MMTFLSNVTSEDDAAEAPNQIFLFNMESYKSNSVISEKNRS